MARNENGLFPVIVTCLGKLPSFTWSLYLVLSSCRETSFRVNRLGAFGHWEKWSRRKAKLHPCLWSPRSSYLLKEIRSPERPIQHPRKSYKSNIIIISLERNRRNIPPDQQCISLTGIRWSQAFARFLRSDTPSLAGLILPIKKHIINLVNVHSRRISTQVNVYIIVSLEHLFPSRIIRFPAVFLSWA